MIELMSNIFLIFSCVYRDFSSVSSSEIGTSGQFFLIGSKILNPQTCRAGYSIV